MLVPGHTDSCHPRCPVARDRVGYVAEERRPTTCFRVNVALVGRVECLLLHFSS